MPIDWMVLAAALVPGLVLIAALWQRPEYGLLVYGIALGFPDVVLPLSAVNLRIEDGLVAFYAVRLVAVPGPWFTAGQQRILAWVVAFAAVCLASAATALVRGYDHYYLYTLAKFIGCLVAVVVVPLVADRPHRLRFLAAGLMIGGVGLVAQMVWHLLSAAPGSIVTFQDLKYSATPTSWNPNTVGQSATLLAFGAALGAAASPGGRHVKRLYFALGSLFVAIPFAIFSRGAALGLAAGYAIFTTLTGRVRVLIVVVALAAVAGSSYLATLPPGVANATNVDTSTGDGLSGRYERWTYAWDAIRERPLLGYGFGQEFALYEQGFGTALAHNSFLSTWIELGIAGPLVLVGMLWAYTRVAFALLAQQATRPYGAAILGVIVALILQGLGNSSLYWDKQPAIALAVALAAVGVAERARVRVLDDARAGLFPGRRRAAIHPSSPVPA